MSTQKSSPAAATRLMCIGVIGLVIVALGACTSGGTKTNVTRGAPAATRYVPSRTTTPAEATRRSEWRYQSPTRYRSAR